MTLTYRNIYDIPESRTFVTDDATGQTRLATREDWVQTGTVQETLPNGQLSRVVPVYDLRDGLDPHRRRRSTPTATARWTTSASP